MRDLLHADPFAARLKFTAYGIHTHSVSTCFYRRHVAPGTPMTQRACRSSAANSTISGMEDIYEPNFSSPRPFVGRPSRGYPRKTSFYQPDQAADRMRGAFLNTVPMTGYSSLSEFINAAVAEKVAGLEHSYNGGQPWQPVAAGEIPQGKPRSVSATAGATTEEFTPQRPAQDLVEIVDRLRSELGECEAFYGEGGKKLIVASVSGRDGSTTLRLFEYLHAGDPVLSWSDAGIRWQPQPDLESKP